VGPDEVGILAGLRAATDGSALLFRRQLLGKIGLSPGKLGLLAFAALTFGALPGQPFTLGSFLLGPLLVTPLALGLLARLFLACLNLGRLLRLGNPSLFGDPLGFGLQRRGIFNGWRRFLGRRQRFRFRFWQRIRRHGRRICHGF
jgi:hypothetical protein